MTQIELIRQEIERQKFTIEGMFLKGDDSYYEGENDGYDRILSFLDNLQGQTVTDSKKLEEEINKWLDGPTTDLRTMARHFAEWQKEQMLKDAVEGEVYKFAHYSYVKERNRDDLTKYLSKFNDGDKVRIVVLKEEEE